MTDDADTTRTPSAIDRIADDYLEAGLELTPMGATYLGIPGYDHRLDDFSPDGLRAQRDLAAGTLDRLEGLEPVDDVDRVTLDALRERLGLQVASADRVLDGRDPAPINVIASPVQGVCEIFALMPTQTEEHWRTVATRLRAVPEALAGYRALLEHGAGHGAVAPQRQVERVSEQARAQSADGSAFTALVGTAPELPEQVRAEVDAAVEGAHAAYAGLADYLADTLLSQAPESDAAGVERYRLASQEFLGARVDLEETYRWGLEEVARIDAMMRETAEAIRPGASVKEAVAILDEDPAYQLNGTDELRAWMQEKADGVVADLGGTHFDVPEPVRRIECMIAPTHTGAIYYTGPSEDFSRPGRMWWSVPQGTTRFSTWRELTTVYHEGVPGHHLQVGQTVYRSSLLNRWRRMACWVSGHGEGWALYAEWLMADLGYMDDPGNRMGLLDAQALRAVRVVIDIGVHCGFEAPAEVGGGEWTYDKAWQYLTTYTNGEEKTTRFELDRYLGWPGQAPSYKIGERLWLELREQVRERDGEDFDLQAFHRRALDVGSVGLDTLRKAVLQDW